MTKIISLVGVAGLIFLLAACSKKKKTGNPFDELLASPTYSGITDSITADPGNDALYFRRAVLLNSNNLTDPALRDFSKAWSLKKEEQYALGMGMILLERNPDSALLFMEGAIKELPQSFLLQLTMARAHAGAGKPKLALVTCNQLLELNPNQVDVLKLKADLMYREGEREEAVSTLEKAYRLTPYDIELNYMLALWLAESGNIRLITLCDSLIRADSAGIHAEPYYYKGIYFSALNDKQKALLLFDEAIRINYNFLDSYIEKGALLFEMKKYPDALSVFNLCLTVSPKFADSYYWIARCEEALGKKEEAKLNYERAFSLDNTLVEAKAALEKLK